ncbi:MAG: alkaline phosphatase [Planctomyces sp.]|nr:alkaline phosphatase [Planctomyces sp.]
MASVFVFSVPPSCGNQEETKQESETKKTEVKAAEKKEDAVDEQAVEQARIESRDFVRRLQEQAFRDQKSALGYWGVDPENYFGWKSHSNRMIPVYTYGTKGAGSGVDLSSWTGDKSVYRSEAGLARIYGYVPEHTVDPSATWMDQTNIYDLQMEGIAAGKKYVFLVIFDGMDWQSTQAAGIYNSGRVYTEGKGHGTFFQEYEAGGTAQFGWMVTSPHNDGTDIDPSTQTVVNPGGKTRGGYHSAVAGATPWSRPGDLGYMIGKPAEGNPTHAYTDSSSSACSMTAGAKLFNGAINVDPSGSPIMTIAHRLQDEGISVGAISSVPISHATPAAAYAHNVSRDDYQDLTRDMLGLPSVQHPKMPLSGLDVVIGGGWGVIKKDGKDQGDNFVPGNVFLTDADLRAVDIRHGGKYVTAVREPGKNGRDLLAAAARDAVHGKHRLLGFFGNGAYNGHLPFATADGQFDPVEGVNKKREKYRPADIFENPTLSQMTEAGIEVLSQNPKGFWLLVEPGDVDWANHDDNVDASIGAVNSGDAAVRVIAEWVERNSNWQESLMIVTADHGHLFNLERPELLLRSSHPESTDQGN